MTANHDRLRRLVLERVRDRRLDASVAARLLARAGLATGREAGLVTYLPEWQAAPADPRGRPELPPGDVLFIVTGPDPAGAWGPVGDARVARAGPHLTGAAAWSGFLAEEFAARGRPRGVVFAVPTDAPSPRPIVDLLLPAVQALIADRAVGELPIAFLTADRDRPEVGAALGALAQVLAAEDRRLRAVAVRVAEVPAWATGPFEVARGELTAAGAGLAEVRHGAAGREVRVLRPRPPVASAPPPFRTGGRYLITGGGGGIGLRLADLLAREYAARLVLTGRSAPATELSARLRQLAGHGARVRYERSDVTRYADVLRAVHTARRAYGGLDGVLHCAGVNEDAYLVNKDGAAALRVLSVKLDGAVHLDRATARLPLDVFALFSSASAYLGAAGQADYAAANRALGALAATRADQVAAGLRHGASVAVAWPLWAEGGMAVPAENRAALATRGILGMPTEAGLRALAEAVASGAPETLVLYGLPQRIAAWVAQLGAPQATRGPAPGGPTADDVADVADVPEAGPVPEGDSPEPALLAAAETYLLGLVSEAARLPPGRLRADQEFSTLGVDSILIKKLTATLADRFGELPVTLLFEYRTVAELARYLAGRHPQALRAGLDPAPSPPGTAPTPADPRRPQRPRPEDGAPVGNAAPPGDTAPAGNAALPGGTAPAGRSSAADTLDGGLPYERAVAIVGLAGRYPGGADLVEFWQSLASGADLIREIPADRWDNSRYLAAERGAPGAITGRWGGFLDDVARFDPLFFALSPGEAARLDPNERLFLEVAWSALEHAGYARRKLHEATLVDGAHAVGVFVGVTGSQYGLVGAEQWGRGNRVLAHSMDYSIANRLSYVLDAHGPSMVVDTACSGSLTALHLACRSLLSGECRMALTGGVNVNIHPIKYAALTDLRLLASDGRCRAFGAGGDGFVPGEGVGALVLKRLSDALADGDRVHAVVRGTAINHGGRSNGYTVPTPRAQGAVVTEALRAARMDARSVSYVEAHGTGTALGDPVEIEGLTRAFAHFTTDTGFCAIGSVKSNIGHLEAAAGVCGITKVVLQFAHRTLVPTLHSEPANPQLRLAETPFRPQRSTEPWHSPPGVPRRAAVSSFGAGGAGGHVVLEEWPAPAPSPDGDRPHVVGLSARTPKLLRRTAQRIVADLARDPDRSLRDIAFTLLTGREEWDHRLAVVASSVAELCSALREHLDGGRSTAVYTGTGTAPAVPAASVARALATGRWAELAQAWVGGARVPWPDLFRDGPRPVPVPLPASAFDDRRYWVEVVPERPADGTPHPEPARAPRPAPAVLRRHDAVVSDHRVGGRFLVAGVVQLELARAAAGLAGAPTVFEQVRWRVPLEVTGDGLDVAVDVAEGGGAYTVRDAGTGTAHSTGTLGAGPTRPPRRLDVAAALARCPRHVTGDEVYRAAQAAELCYGPLYRGLVALRRGVDEALGELSPPVVTAPDWALDAALTDAALHAVQGVLSTASWGPALPASVDRLTVYGPARRARYAHVRLVAQDAARGTARVDVDLAAPDGSLLAGVEGLRIARPGGHTPPCGAPEVPLYRTVWRPAPLAEARPYGADGRPVLVLGTAHDHGLGASLAAYHRAAGHAVTHASLADVAPCAEAYRAVLDRAGDPGTVWFLGGVEERLYPSDDLDQLDTALDTGPVALFHLLRALATGRAGQRVRLHVVTCGVQQTDAGTAARNPFAGGLPGLTAAASRELGFLDATCVDLDRADLVGHPGDEARQALVGQLAAEPPARPAHPVALSGGVRYVQRHERVDLSDTRGGLPLRSGGRYLITGGAGGLGTVVAGWLARSYDARVLLTGRREPGELPPRARDLLAELPRQVAYARADVTDEAALRSAVHRMRRQWGGVDGVVHAAFVLRDRTLARMDEETLRASLAPKAHGTVLLHRVLLGEPLDFFALFSSAISHNGNAGQANYAAASTVQDAYGRFLATHWGMPVRIINWGLWGESGSVATDDYRASVAERLGVEPISDAAGLAAFRQVLAGPAVQVAPVRLARAADEGAARPERAAANGARALRAAEAAGRRRGTANTPLAAGDFLEAVEPYARLLLRDAFRAHGGWPPPGTTVSRDALARRLGVEPARRRLLDAALGALHRGGHVVEHPTGTLTVPDGEPAVPDPAAAEALRTELVARYPHTSALTALLRTCAQAVPEVLCGRRDGLSVLFPGGSDHQVAPLYHQDPRSEHFNAVCAAAVAAYTGERLEQVDAPLRLLEVGAGTGGTSRPVLEALRPFRDRCRYTFTDISPALVRRARDRFGSDHPQADFAVLDITADPAAQGFAEGAYDVVLAANVLHATPDVRRTVRTAARLLRPGGLLLVNEGTRVLDAVTVIFGLTEGWWAYDDPEVRQPHSPLLTPGTWRSVLVDSGLRGVRAIGAREPDGADAGQHVFLAERDEWPVPRGTAHPLAGAAAGAGPEASAAHRAPAAEPRGDADAAHRRGDAEAELRSAATSYVAGVFGAVLKLDPDELDPAAPLSAYGTDSLVSMEVAERIEGDLGPFPRPVPFESTSLHGIVDTLLAAPTRPLDRLVRDGASPPGPRHTGRTEPGGAAPGAEPGAAAAGSSGEPASPVDEPAPVREPAPVDEPALGDEPAPVGKPAAVVEPAPAGSRAPRTAPVRVDAPVAIVGLSGRFAGAETVDALWERLSAGRSAVTEVPTGRWGAAAGGGAARWGAFLADVEAFDPLVFRMSPRDAERTDPQERLLLEAVWTALEDAGTTRAALEDGARATTGTGVGVFVGLTHTPYRVLAAQRRGAGADVHAHSAHWSAANRTSHAFGFTGPSLAVDTACSSALTALHLACEAIRRGECGAAVAGGVSLLLEPSHHRELADMRMLSPHGRARPFARDADGMVPGEGVGAVVLKPLSAALRDRDRVHGLVLGSAINANGATESMVTPSAAAQEEVVRQALARAGVRPEAVHYVEAQATGSPLADPVEATALGRVFGGYGTAVGSVKPVLGHVEAASGMAQLAKVLLQMRHGRLVATPGCERPVPAFDGAALHLVREGAPWPHGAEPAARTAALSSFGAGGANAHVVVAGPPDPQRPNPEHRGPWLVLLSARREAQLRELAGRLRGHLDRLGSAAPPLADVARSLARGREPLAHRLAVVANGVPDLVAVLDRYLADEHDDRLRSGTASARARGSRHRVDPPATEQELREAAAAWASGAELVACDAALGLLDGLVVTLPSYPFARIPHRLPVSPGPAADTAAVDHGPTPPDPPPTAAAPDRGPTPPEPPPHATTPHHETTPPEPPPTAAAPGHGPSGTCSAAGCQQPPDDREEIAVPPTTGRPPTPATVAHVRTTVVGTVAAVLKVQPEDVGLEEHLSDFGFDSVTVIELTDQVNATLGTTLSPADIYGFRDVAALVEALAQQTPAAAVAGADGQPTDHAPGPSGASTAPPRPEEHPPTGPEPGAGSRPHAHESADAGAGAAPPRPRPGPLPPTAPAASDREPVAIVGMAGAFPGSPDLPTYWSHLLAGRDLVEEVPAERFDWREIYGDPVADPTKVPSRWGGFLADADVFDPGFFRISQREARLMDPQHRLFLHTVWHAIEDSGHDPTSLAGTDTAVFVGCGSTEYATLLLHSGIDIDGQVATGNAHSVLANRVSFLLDLRGPSEPVDTACSSSLVAVHRAVRAIDDGECSAAIAGGVNLTLTPTGYLAFGKSGMLAPDGRCKTFDHRADGYVRGEGVGAVFLKPLSAALRDGDTVYALIRGSAVNHGGRAASLTAPNPTSQAAVITAAHRRGGTDAGLVGYVEAHGTGTSLGDPVELSGLTRAFRELGVPADRRQFIGLGSVKTNVGHLETAAGIAGLVKVVLALRHRMLPPSLHLQRPNPLLDLADSPFRLLDTACPWHRPRRADGTRAPRLAGVSSFGFGGVNAHVVVEEFTGPHPAAPASNGPALFVLSARTDERLRAYATRLADHLERATAHGSGRIATASLARTLQSGRPALERRLAVVTDSTDELVRALRAFATDGEAPVPWHVSPAAPDRAARGLLDEDDRTRIVDLARGGDLDKAAALWVRGTAIDWARLYEGAPPRRVAGLPGYPFARERYWLPSAPAARARPTTVAGAAPAPTGPRTTPTGSGPPHAAPPPSPPTPAPAQAPAPAPPAPAARATGATSAGPAADPPPVTGGLAAEVRSLLAEGIGLAPEAVDPQRDLSAYGVDSISALRIMQRLQATFGDHIPMAAIFECATLNSLVQHLVDRYGVPPQGSGGHRAPAPGGTGEPAPTAVPPRQAAQAPKPQTPEPQTPEPQAAVVPFPGGGPGTPLHALPGATGELTWLLRLRSWLAADGPVRGVEFTTPAPRGGAGQGLAELARACARAVLADRPQGPYRLAGHSIAARLAVETARSLTDSGHEVAELVLLEAPGPDTVPEGDAAADVCAVAEHCAAVWSGAPLAAAPDGRDRDTALRSAAEHLAALPDTPLSGGDLVDRLAFAADWRGALRRAASETAARPLALSGRAVVLAVPDARSWDRALVPPPVLLAPPAATCGVVGAEGAAELAARRAEPAARPAPRKGADRGVRTVPARDRRFLVPINRGGDKTPSFWVHHLFGDVSYCIYLSRYLGMDHPLYGLEQLDSDLRLTEFPSIEAMAARYVAEVRQERPDGPYVLGGASFGGILAFEMARQLTQARAEVAHLYLVDALLPGTGAWDGVDNTVITEENQDAVTLMLIGNSASQLWNAEPSLTVDALAGMGPDEAIDHVTRHVVQGSPAELSADEVHRLVRTRFALLDLNGRLLLDYRARPFARPVPTTVFRATHGFSAAGNPYGMPAIGRDDSDATNGLGTLAGDEVTVHDLDADHFTIVLEDNLRAIADVVSRTLPALAPNGRRP